MGRYEENRPFFKLLSLALRGESDSSFSLTLEQWDRLYSTAVRQTVNTFLFPLIENLPETSGLSGVKAYSWYSAVQKNLSHIKAIDSVTERQSAIWKKEGVNAVLLKGRSVSRYYPLPDYRMCGDIDWWMKGTEDWNKALSILQRNSIKYKTDSDGDISYSIGGVVVEHHREGLASDGPEAELLLLNEHIFHHVAVLGIGLRQFCDYIFAKKQLDFDQTTYAGLIESRGLSKWTAVLEKACLALEQGVESSDPDSEILLELVLEDGNMGLDKSNRFSGFIKRAMLLIRIAPGPFFRRWAGLISGRIKRIFKRR